jgi:cytochrome c biogenesis protein CcdA
MELTIATVLGLAAADAINPCELAILLMVLMAILTRFPRDRKKVLKIGLAFTATMFVMYFLYGLLLVNVFKTVAGMASIKFWMYKVLGVVGIIMGLSNIKDFFSYGSLGYATEVPKKWRPKMKEMISKITSVKGAIVIGIFCSLFLTPCTMGPYIICTGILQPLTMIQVIPWLIIYNLIFVLPMIAITLLVYFGLTTVDSLFGWREKNIKTMHLTIGLILVLIGLALLFGWMY